jgi:hypothetical protein
VRLISIAFAFLLTGNVLADDATDFCIAEANERIAAADPMTRNNIGAAEGFYNGARGLRQHNGNPLPTDNLSWVEANCTLNHYWYKTIPKPKRTLHCNDWGNGDIDCREQ